MLWLICCLEDRGGGHCLSLSFYAISACVHSTKQQVCESTNSKKKLLALHALLKRCKFSL